MIKLISTLLLFAIIPGSHAQTTAKLLAAPDVIPPATEEMQHPEFWISRINNPDRVIMSPQQITEFNRKNRSRSLIRKDFRGNTVVVDSVLTGGSTFTGISFHLCDPLSIRDYPGIAVTKQLSEIRDFIVKTEFWDRRQIPLPENGKRELIADMNMENIPAVIRPRYGVIIRHTLNRLAPTAIKVYRGQFQWLDAFQNATLETGMPAAVLHASKSGNWLYVKTEYSQGWVTAANIAFGSANRIRTVSEPKNFVMTIVHKATVYADRECNTWLTDIYLGERLGLEEKTDSAFRVSVPVRQPDGTLGVFQGWIKSDAGVNIGYQQYTQRNVITTIFRLLNRPYGWGGTDHERDCVGTIRSVYRTFGIFIPRWTTFMLYHTDQVIAFPDKTPIEEKYRLLDTCDPGITICGFNGHVVLYLGKVDQTHYIIHQNGYSYHDEKGTEFRVARVSVNHTELEGGADIRRWTELSVYK
jgi:cell wall-associated NlpC family hydrolase